MKNMDLQIENLDAIEAPLSDDFWTGVAVGIIIGAVVVAT